MGMDGSRAGFWLLILVAAALLLWWSRHYEIHIEPRSDAPEESVATDVVVSDSAPGDSGAVSSESDVNAEAGIEPPAASMAPSAEAASDATAGDGIDPASTAAADTPQQPGPDQAAPQESAPPTAEELWQASEQAREEWESRLMCAINEDEGRCACYAADGRRAELTPERCRELARRGAGLAEAQP